MVTQKSATNHSTGTLAFIKKTEIQVKNDEQKGIIMKKSKDEKVQKFLDEIIMIDSAKYNTLNVMREIVFQIYPKTDERIMYGGIMFSLDTEDFGGLFVRKNHISFEFIKGFIMKDPNKLLEGSGKFRRHLKIKSKEDIGNKNVDFFVKQAV